MVEFVENLRTHTRPDLYERFFRSDLGAWIQITTAMDLIGDSAGALLEYEEGGIGERQGEKYLRLYGCLQAVVIQQDSLRSLAGAVFGSRPKSPQESAWMEIRDLRNLVVGHPADKRGPESKGKQRIGVAQTTIKKGGFMLVVHSENAEMDLVEVDFARLYERYKVESADLASRIHGEFVRRWPAR